MAIGGIDRYPVRQLAALTDDIVRIGRSRGVFGYHEVLNVGASDVAAWATLDGPVDRRASSRSGTDNARAGCAAHEGRCGSHRC